MNKKKILFIIIFIILLVAVGILGYMRTSKETEVSIETEITPLEEITEEQERETMISLYFISSENNTLVPEARKIDVKELVENPYKTLVEFLIEGPKNESLTTAIPDETKVNDATLNNGIVELDLSKEFIENQEIDIEKAKLSIYSIVNTLTELNEVNGVKILIEGKENIIFNNIEINLEKIFYRQD